jgi:cell division protein ZapB
MADFDLDILESQVEDLIRACNRLREDNASLRASKEHLIAERTDLIEKTELARSRIEAIVTRLKLLENQE